MSTLSAKAAGTQAANGKAASTDPAATTPAIRSTRHRRVDRSQWVGYLYIAPAIALVIVFFVVPLGMTAWMSLHN